MTDKPMPATSPPQQSSKRHVSRLWIILAIIMALGGLIAGFLVGRIG
jgi:hypothetical protein